MQENHYVRKESTTLQLHLALQHQYVLFLRLPWKNGFHSVVCEKKSKKKLNKFHLIIEALYL